MNIGILGAGSWGTALSILLCGNGHDVCVWSIDPEEVLMLKDYREQRDKLPGVMVPSTIEFTTELETALKDAELVVCAVPSPFVRSTMKNASPYIKEGTIVVDVAKGIEDKTYKTMTEIISEECPQARIGILSGPSHAEEVGRKIPTTIVAGSKDKEVAETIQDAFMNDYFRVYTSPDVIGIELGGSLKNVIALAAGVVDGLGYGDNTKAALMTRGIAEMSRLVIAMGGNIETVAGLSGIGDLIVTCTSKHSRNRNAGFLIGQGKSYHEAMDEVKMVVEGVYSAKAAYELGKKYNVSMPIVEAVNRVLFEGVNAREEAAGLLLRDRTMESANLGWD
ncbi:MAG: NAD(P)H-dependent glycerol-3-phosphate dehydrogenase [Lachnospiraceae bacterium]|nr:NAD(P)H-dependent glycerol-3-phosphate dehydrogenase [Lachnospiraceae bacterium]